MQAGLLLGLGGCRGIQPCVVVGSFTTATTTLGAQLVVAGGERAKIHCKTHQLWLHILGFVTNVPLAPTARPWVGKNAVTEGVRANSAFGRDRPNPPTWSDWLYKSPGIGV
jgi:hypothetical protein